MKVLYLPDNCVDCTSDAHEVNYGTLKEALNDILKVCESDLVSGIVYVSLYESNDYSKGEVKRYQSDYYHDSTYGDKSKMALTEEAKKHKVYGLIFDSDYNGPPERHLLPGLTGLKEAIKLIKASPTKFKSLHVDVCWSAWGAHNCSDDIDFELESIMVNYSNQDWYVGDEHYSDHIERLATLLGRDLEEGEE